MQNNTPHNRAVIVPASAGSGKTYRIAHEYIYDVLRDRYNDDGKPYSFDGAFYKRILAVTFTNKATEEMKSRILKEIHLLAAGEESDHLKKLIEETSLTEAELRRRAKIVRSRILHDYSHFTVLTNDTFFQRILRAFVRELSIDLNFSTELDTAPILTKSVDALIESITSNEVLRGWLEDLTNDRIRDGEKWDIRNAITALNGELFKEGTRDIIKKATDKESLKQAIDSFAAVVEEKRQELMKMGQRAVDAIHGLGYTNDNFKLKFTKVFNRAADGTLDKITDATLKHLSDEPENWFAKGKISADLIQLASKLQVILNEIYIFLLDFKTLENTHRILQRNYRGFALLHDLQNNVEEICRKENAMFLSETKHAIAGFISESDAPFIYEKVGNYFDKFMIDEFQDTSVKEWNNFLPLLRNAMAQSQDTSVLIVGDVKQSIYRWRGGDWRILGKQASSDLDNCLVDPLKNNWRSLPNIVEFNTALYDKIIKRENPKLNKCINEALTNNRISKKCHTELFDNLQNAYTNHDQVICRNTTNQGYVSIVAPVEDCDLTESGIPLYIKRIKEVLERGFLPRDITILVRKNSEGMDIAEELLHHRDLFFKDNGLWFDITTEEALRLTASPAVKFIIAVMRLAINRKDVASLVLYNHLYNNDIFNTQLDEEEHEFLDSIRMMSPEEAFNHIVIRYNDQFEGQTAYILALHEHITRFSAGKVADLDLFDKWWKEKGDSLSIRVEKSDHAIEILTIHKAKGLENKVIIMPRCSWSLEPLDSSGVISNIIWSEAAPNKHLANIGKFPISLNRSVGESLFADGYFREVVYTCVDALNMLYVATTRAKEQMHIFLPSSKGNSVGVMLSELYGDVMQRKEGTSYLQYEFGTFDGPEPSKEKKRENHKTVVLTEHHTSPVDLKLSTSASRYFAEDDTSVTPRSMGIRLHRTFEGATSREDIFAKLDEMAINGELRSEEIEMLKTQISTTLDTTVAGEWFDGSWIHLHSERNILMPNNKTKRPDRVMIRNNEAVVVDYKFGEVNSSYKSQMSSYMSELRQMGYTTVTGYIWYVSTGKIVKIDE